MAVRTNNKHGRVNVIGNPAEVLSHIGETSSSMEELLTGMLLAMDARKIHYLSIPLKEPAGKKEITVSVSKDRVTITK